MGSRNSNVIAKRTFRITMNDCVEGKLRKYMKKIEGCKRKCATASSRRIQKYTVKLQKYRRKLQGLQIRTNREMQTQQVQIKNLERFIANSSTGTSGEMQAYRGVKEVIDIKKEAIKVTMDTQKALICYLSNASIDPGV